MEPLLYPLSVDEYCNYFNIAKDSLTLPCIFCKAFIDAFQLSTFQDRQLSLVWRGNSCFAACLRCIRSVAKLERYKFFQCSVKGEYIEHFTQTPLQNLIVRCLHCMCLLSSEEKVEIIACGEQFYLVRGSWKGVCRKCSENAWGESNN